MTRHDTMQRIAAQHSYQCNFCYSPLVCKAVLCKSRLPFFATSAREWSCSQARGGNHRKLGVHLSVCLCVFCLCLCLHVHVCLRLLVSVCLHLCVCVPTSYYVCVPICNSRVYSLLIGLSICFIPTFSLTTSKNP